MVHQCTQAGLVLYGQYPYHDRHVLCYAVLLVACVQVVDIPNPSKTSGRIDWSGLSNGDAWVALITFLYLDFLDATGEAVMHASSPAAVPMLNVVVKVACCPAALKSLRHRSNCASS
jgi:hypothetical protein